MDDQFKLAFEFSSNPYRTGRLGQFDKDSGCVETRGNPLSIAAKLRYLKQPWRDLPINVVFQKSKGMLDGSDMLDQAGAVIRLTGWMISWNGVCQNCPDDMKIPLTTKWVNIAARILLIVAIICAFANVLIMWKGGAWTWGIHLRNPMPRFVIGSLALLSWYILLHLAIYSLRDWLKFSAKLMLLFISLSVTLMAGEIFVRRILVARQKANSFVRFKEYHQQGKKMPIHSTHPMATIIQPSDAPGVIYELQPDLDITFEFNHLRTNHAGMRAIKNYTTQHLPNSVRIIGIGDSGMFGLGVEQDDTYLAVLESNLNARADGVTYEVLNLAVPGYNTQLEVAMFCSKGIIYHPDIVLVGWCVNDFSLPLFLLEEENFHRKDVSYLYYLLFDRARISPDESMYDIREYDKGKVVPVIYAGASIEGVKQALLTLKTLSEREKFYLLLFGPMRREIVKICDEIGVSYCNTYDKIPGETYPKEYAIYYNVLAEYLERDLRERGWLHANIMAKVGPIPGG